MTIETNYAGGTRITSGAVRVGDFIRFAGHKIPEAQSMEWWKVTDLRGWVVDIVNARGAQRARTMQNWDKIYRHPYSQKRAA